MKKKRLFSLPSLYYTHGSAGCACAGAQAKENLVLNQKLCQKLLTELSQVSAIHLTGKGKSFKNCLEF